MKHVLSKRILFAPALLCLFHEASAQQVALLKDPATRMDVVQEAKSLSLSAAIAKLQQHYHIKLLYREELITNKEVPVLELTDRSLEEALTEILAPHNLEYTRIKEDFYAIAPKKGARQNPARPDFLRVPVSLPSLSWTNERSEFQVTGKVTDDTGMALPGVSVVVKGTTIGASTDTEGMYTLNAPSADGVLVFSFIGFVAQEVPINSQGRIDIRLVTDTKALDEVVIVGYGVQEKVNLTGSVASIEGDKLANRPLTNISTALQGQLPGVAVIQQSGQPGRDNGIIRIRGVGTMNNAAPMVVVDGIVSSMEDLNPNDIESISVLKDASSSAIYGSRAANGVILITTKRGKAGTPKISYNGYIGWQQLTNLPEYLNAYEYANLLNEGYKNEGKPARYTPEELEKFRSGLDPVNYPNTDWMDLVFQGSGLQQSHNISVSGGSETSRYLLSLGFLDQDGLIKNTNSDRYNVRFNLDSKVSQKFSIGLNSNFSRQNINEPSGVSGWNGISAVLRQIARIPSTALNKYPDGSWGRHIDGNPIAWVEDGGLSTDIVSHALGNVFGELNIIKGLKLRGDAGIDYNLLDRTIHQKDITYGDGSFQGPNNVTDMMGRSTRIILQAVLTYQKSISNHNINALFGTSREDFRYDQDDAYRQNFPNNDLTEINAGDVLGMRNSGYSYETRLGSYFGRLNYNYKEKYLLEGSMRYDGSSKFAEDKRWGLFPSFSAGWRISEESFMKETSVINNLKLRGSYGLVGNNSTGDYQFIPRIALGQNYPFGGTIASGAAQVAPSNPNLQWEKSTTFNVGVDVGFFNNKLTFAGDYYNRYTDDILIAVPVSFIYGLPAPTVNAGAMRNKGFEFLIGHTNQIGDFSYTTSFNISFNKNEVEKFANPSKGSRIQAEGFPWNAFYGYENIGKYQTDEQVQSAPKVPGTPVQKGDLMFKDQDGDGEINANDRIVLGSDIPGVTYGLNLGLKYKDFDVSAFGQGAADVYQLLANEIYFPFVNGAQATKKNLDRWTPETPNGRFPLTHVDQTHNFNNISSFQVVNASYLRLKSLQIGYTLPESVISSLKIDHIRIYVTGQNLLTISKLDSGFDPESQVNAQSVYPNVKIYTAGFNINF